MSGIKRDQKRNLIRRAALKQRIGLSDATIWRYERAGKFPARVVISEGGRVAWYEDEIDAWIANCIRSGGRRPSGVLPAEAPAVKAQKPRKEARPAT